MDSLPSVKSHPVLMSLVTVTFFIGVLVAGAVGGWFLRAMSESRAELSVVVDDGEFMQALEVQTQKWVDEFNKTQEDFYIENKHIPDCYIQPMPDYYHSNDFVRVQSDREQEE